jgi:O-antigen/teichoic acid export membrane protein
MRMPAAAVDFPEGAATVGGLTRQAGLIALARFANQALVILSPIILVRLLSVAEFGRYREFLLYVGLLAAIAGFGINHSLLYFVPAKREGAWRYVRQGVMLTALNSIAGACILVALNALLNGALVGDFALQVALYVVLFANVDFWEFFWLAKRRAGAWFAYTSGRLVARMTVVIVAAAVTGDVDTIIWALIGLEGVRLAISTIGWRRRVSGPEKSTPESWREQLRYCTPVGASLILVTLNKSLGALFVTKLMGPIALAHYTIGTYVQPVVSILRNSLSDVLLPEMASRSASRNDPLELWRRTTVLAALLLLPAGLVLATFAEPLVVTVFSEEYRAAVPVLQLYLLVLIRECFDFGVPLRALNRTAPIAHSNFLAMLLNVALLFALLPRTGLVGAVGAFVVSRFAEGFYLGWRTLRLYRIGVRELASWADLARVLMALAPAAVVLLVPQWTALFGLAGALLATLAFLVTFLAALLLLRLPEAVHAVRRLRGPLGAET